MGFSRVHEKTKKVKRRIAFDRNLDFEQFLHQMYLMENNPTEEYLEEESLLFETYPLVFD